MLDLTNLFLFYLAGSIRTELIRSTGFVMKVMMKPIMILFFKNAVEGAQTTLHCALQEGLEPLSGSYFSNCSPKSVYTKARDDTAAKKLWELSERLSGLNWSDLIKPLHFKADLWLEIRVVIHHAYFILTALFRSEMTDLYTLKHLHIPIAAIL